MNCDRVVFGPDAKVIFSMTQEGRKKAAVTGSYEARVITALTERSFSVNPSLIHELPQLNTQDTGDTFDYIQRFKKKFSLQPLRILDLPNFPSDLLQQSLSLHNNALAVLLDGVCYVVKAPCSQKHSILEVFATKNMHLRCIEWINKETLAVGGVGHEHVFIVNTHKPQPFRYHGFHVGEKTASITKITRISDTTFFTGYKSGILLHNDLSSDKVTRLLDRSNDAIVSISPSPDKTRVAVGFDSGRTKIYALTMHNNVPEVMVKATLLGGRAFSWQPGSNSNCITGSLKDRTIRYYQLPSTVPTHTIGVEYAVSSVVFLEKNVFLAGSESLLSHFCITQKDIRLVNAEEMKTDGSLIDVVYEQGVGLITASSDEILRIYSPAAPEFKKLGQEKAKSSTITSWTTKIR